jgi:hypothetical protein
MTPERRDALARFVLRVLGRPMRCSACGEELFRGIVLPSGGRVRVIGAGRAHVRVRFEAVDVLSFAHIEPNDCPPLRRGPTSP